MIVTYHEIEPQGLCPGLPMLATVVRCHHHSTLQCRKATHTNVQINSQVWPD
jgi:hypothetical protein